MKTNNKLKLGMFFLVVILLMVSVSADYMRTSNIQYAQFDSGHGGVWKPDRDMCEAGQDFVVQIAPFGCTPAVVRADLLEEQNVPVFCQLAATKINPLIEVDAIESMRFSGEYPKEVSGIGFHPARAALGVGSNLNSPILNNIGYAVIVLKKQENASAMPEFVEGTLTADIRYDIKNAFGIGKASFYLPEMSDDDWDDKKVQYSFWNGKGYLRAEGIDESGARISVYDDTRKIASVDLDKGKTSRMIYLPGFDCLAGLKLKLDGLEAPDTRAKLEINGEIVEVAEGEKFLENRCWIKKIDKKGLVQEVEVYCKGDEERGNFNLRISPKVELEFDGAKKEGYEVGDWLYKTDDNEKSVYLGYIGTKGDTENLKNLYFYFVAIPQHRTIDGLTEDELSSINRLVYSYEYQKVTGVGVADFMFNLGKVYVGVATNFYKWLTDGTSLTRLSYSEKTTRIGGKEIEIIGFAGAVDKGFGEEKKEYYESANQDYNLIIKSFPFEQISNTKITYGEEALYRKILLAWNTEQKKTIIDLCKEFKNQYPDSKQDLKKYCDDLYKLSSSEIASRDVSISGVVKRISFDGVYEPTLKEYSAEIRVSGPNGKTTSFSFGKNQIIYLDEFRDADESTKETVQLISLDDGEAKIKLNLLPEGVWETIKKATISSDTKILKEGVSESVGSGYIFTLTKINLKKSVKVSVVPNINNAGTEANFSFKIGIEQRAIKLSPEKTREKIEQLNKTIEGWEKKSEQLGKVVQGLKTACLATGTFLTVKNFFANTGGKAIARQEVMTEINLMCANAINGKGDWGEEGYKTLNECFVEKSKYINDAVDEYDEALKGHNDYFEDLQDDSEITTKNWLGERNINNEKLKEKLLDDEDFVEKLKTNLNQKFPKGIKYEGTTIQVNNFVDNYLKKDIVSISELKSLNLNSQLTGSLKEMADKKIEKDIISIWVSNKDAKEMTNFAERTGFPEVHIMSFDKRQKKIPFTQDVKWGSVDEKYSGATIDNDKHVQNYKDPTTNSEYILMLDDDNSVEKTYEITATSKEGINTLEEYTGDDKNNQRNPLRLIYEKRDSSTYQNPYISSLGKKTPCLRYYETEPGKRLPAIVPFDLKNGWYASVSQVLPVFGGIKSYSESGRVESFWVCNVGKNGIEQNRNPDDDCTMINTGTGQPIKISGLSDSVSLKIVNDAKDAIAEASRKQKSASSGKSIMINGQSVRVCEPAVDVPEMQCQSFMSPKDCQLLFNVCDPVVCPSSRCNFGGTYHVKDVIQSGIIGSIALCLPNWPEVKIPVCLTGIKAGIDGLISVYTSYRDCLQESLDTGKMVGICDEIYSIHLCEFFWRQSLPLAKIIIPKMMEIAMGQNVRGGGEYLGVATAWANAEKSIDYFAQYYAASSYQAFKARIVEGVGDAVCQSSISASYPDGGNLLDSLTEPDSPPQFHGRFDEIPFTTATSPPISHYKVFYHIYAGKESRAYYRVYLKSPPGTSFYQDTPIRNVASGYITTGGYATETKDFTAPSGYKELCIMVNNQEECGFKQVSTSYAVNYVRERYMEEQASERDIKLEKECIGGSVSAYSLLSPSLEGAADEMINPAIYNRGIIRICATESPGKGTDGAWDGEGARWIQVGNCGQENIKCWLDKKSVENVIKHTDIEERVLEEHAKSQLELLKEEGGYFGESVFNDLVEKIRELIEEGKSRGEREFFEEAVSKISEEVMKKAFLNKEKAELLLLRGNAYSGLVGELENGEDSRSVEEAKKEIAKMKDYKDMIEKIAKEQNVDENLVKAIIRVESNWNQDAISPDGSTGLMQLLERGTNGAKVVGAVDDIKDSSKPCYSLCNDYYQEKWKENTFEGAKTNVNLGTCYFKCLQEVYGITDNELAIAAYNAGPTKVKKKCAGKYFSDCKDDLPLETQNYVLKVFEYYVKYSTDFVVEMSSEPKSQISESDSESVSFYQMEGTNKLILHVDFICDSIKYNIIHRRNLFGLDNLFPDSKRAEGISNENIIEFNLEELVALEDSGLVFDFYAEVYCYDSNEELLWYDESEVISAELNIEENSPKEYVKANDPCIKNARWVDKSLQVIGKRDVSPGKVYVELDITSMENCEGYFLEIYNPSVFGSKVDKFIFQTSVKEINERFYLPYEVNLIRQSMANYDENHYRFKVYDPSEIEVIVGSEITVDTFYAF